MENEHGKEADGIAINSSRQALLFQCVQGVSQTPTIPRADGRTRTKLSHQPLHNSPSACTLAGEQQLLVAAHLCRERSQHGAGAAGIPCQPRGFARTLCPTGRWWLQEMLPRETAARADGNRDGGPHAGRERVVYTSVQRQGTGQGGMVLYGFTELVYSTDVREGRKTSLDLMLSEKMFWFVCLSERMVVSDVQFLHCFKECFAIRIKDRRIIYNYKTLSK